MKQNQIVKDDTNYDFEKNIIINQLNFSYNNKSIFENSEIEITKGKTHAIIGPTGCGKSTLVEILLGFKEEDSIFQLMEKKFLIEIHMAGEKTLVMFHKTHI